MSDNAMPLESKHIDAFERAERLLFHFDFCPYFELRKLFPDATDEGRARFRALFRRYYTMNTGGLTDEFIDRYFAIMFNGTIFVDGRPEYESILNDLSAIRRRKGDFAMPFSFVSKLIAMHDDRQPIYDRHVRSFFGVQLPAASMERKTRVEWFVKLLSDVRRSYENWSIDPRMARVLDRLRKRDPQLAACSVVRQLDFLVWKIGNEKLLGTAKSAPARAGDIK